MARSSIPAGSSDSKAIKNCSITLQLKERFTLLPNYSRKQSVEKGIRVNYVSPRPIWTPLNVSDKSGKEVAKHGADTLMKRSGQPEEVASAFVFFASDADLSYISGGILTLLGNGTRAAYLKIDCEN